MLLHHTARTGRWARLAGAGALCAALLATTPVAPASAAARSASAQDASAAQLALRVKLTTLECRDVEDFGGDEIYILVNGHRVWDSSDSIHEGQSVPVNRIVNEGDRVDLYEEDPFNPDDHLGTDYVEGQTGTLVFDRDEALYWLHYGRP
jgi:hypothetical protein